MTATKRTSAPRKAAARGGTKRARQPGGEIGIAPAGEAAASAPPSSDAAADPLAVGQLVATEHGHALVVELTDEGPMLCLLPAPRLYQLPVDAVT